MGKPVKENMGTKLVAPDGGWGWFVVLAYALCNILTIPIMQGFGLLFKDILPNLGLSHTQISVLINTNSAFGMALGLINGPLLRIFGYRTVSIMGSLLYGAGIILTSWANSFTHFMITYGIMASLGMSLLSSSFSLALNMYFHQKRGRAVGLAVTVTGLGPVVMPQVISILMAYYGIQGTVLILGGVCLHPLVGAMLLQPVEWHMKTVEDPENVVKSSANNGEDVERSTVASLEDLETKRMSIIDHDVETGSIYGFDTPLPRKRSTTPGPAYDRSISQYEPGAPTRQQPTYQWWSSGMSLDTINLGSSVKIFDERVYRTLSKDDDLKEVHSSRDENLKNGNPKALLLQKSTIEPLKEEEDEEEPKQRSIFYRAFRTVVLFFDFDLLKDPIYVNIMIGMSVAIFAEINFSLLTPFILADMNFTTDMIATVMSTIAGADLVFRALAPYLGEWLNKPPRTMYLISLLMLIITRSVVIFTDSFTSMIAIGLGLGVAKGIRTVYMSLVIPSYVPIERLASASGIQMVVNGLILMGAGPILGVIRDRTGSYDICIAFINCVTSLTITMWLSEMYVVRRRNKRLERSRLNNLQKK